jgi:hypothetical protein
MDQFAVWFKRADEDRSGTIDACEVRRLPPPP